MLFRHPAHPAKAVRLAYCLNLHPADTLDAFLDGLQRITLPLRERLAKDKEFGVGMYLPAALALELPDDEPALARLKGFLDEHGLDPFTYNAFPYGGFGEAGLKARVFEPTWLENERFLYTASIVVLAGLLARRGASQRQISISTHCGAHSSHLGDPRDRREKLRDLEYRFAGAADAFDELAEQLDVDIVLALEPEPRSSANDMGEARRLLEHAVELAPDSGYRLGACLDACHAAVEFEDAQRVVELAGLHGAGLGKLQFTSALALRDPARNELGRKALFALAEPRYLHQVTGKGAGVVARAHDLPELERSWSDPRSDWARCEEWRCHFHVPVDLATLGAGGLATTRDYADAVLVRALAAPAEWRRSELHVELETYTWDVLPRDVRGAGELVDGLEREYRHVLGVLAAAGWTSA